MSKKLKKIAFPNGGVLPASVAKSGATERVGPHEAVDVPAEYAEQLIADRFAYEWTGKASRKAKSDSDAGKAEAGTVIAEARSEADGIVADAKTKADGLIKDAETKAEDLVKDAEAKAQAVADEAESAAKQMLDDAKAEAAKTLEEAKAKADSEKN